MRKIEGKAVKLDIKPTGRDESELERQKVEEVAERRIKKLENQIAFLLAKYSDVPENLK
ncbi:MAG TPA: hypothetical protein PLA03_12140 [Acidobacteriota bacterium]|nr:hypothetical protein [Acidobacteriota bacterium]